MNDSNRSSFSSRLRSRKGLAIAVVALGVVGFSAWKYLAGGQDEGEYIFGRVEMGDIEDLVTATGTLEPRDYVDVGAQVSGQIEKLYVEVGDQVKAGDVLAEIDAEQAQARVEANQASLASTRINLATQRENLDKNKRDYERQQALMAEKATTEEALLNAKTAYENAVRSVAQQEQQIKQQEANMRIEARNLQYTQIKAPIDGTVMSIAVREGQTVNASQNVPNVMQIANLQLMTVRTDVSEADVNRLVPGMQVYFTTLGAGQGRRYYGQLKRIEPKPKVQQGVTLYPALFDVENVGEPPLMPQQTTQVFFVAAEARDVKTVPMAALQQGQQIAREMAQKERGAGEGQRPAGQQAAPGAPAMAARGGEAPNAAAAAGGSAPATGVAGEGPAAPTVEGGAAPRGPGGNRQGGPGGGFGGRGGFGNFDPSQMTAEQRAQFEQMRSRFRDGGGQGGPGGFGGGGGFRGMGLPGGEAGASRQPQQRRGIVMVKKADGTLEERQVVVGVTDRVLGEVIEGLEVGEEVVIAKREAEPQTGPTATNQNNQNNNFRGNQGGFPGGGGGFRPF